ncbi:MAG TPA: arsenic resistance N-acetyltransferase ArsN2 [Kofleriaceae bacterium]
MTIRELAPADMDAARTLLRAAELPIDDLDDDTIELVGAFDGDTLVGMIGLQTCGSVGLLRSLAVSPGRRGGGVAATLCKHVFGRARTMSSLWLLTTSAKEYFVRHGFEAVSRDAAPDEIRATSQFSSLCPASAHVMRRLTG